MPSEMHLRRILIRSAKTHEMTRCKQALNVLHILKKIDLLRTVYRKVIWEIQNGSSMALKKKLLEALFF